MVEGLKSQESMAENTQKMSNLSLGMIPSMDKPMYIDDTLVIVDDLKREMTPEIDNAITRGKNTELLNPDFEFPCKMDFATVLFCKAGGIFCSLNLKSYEVTTDCILIIPFGIILDKLQYSLGTRFAMICFTKDCFVNDIASRSSKIILKNRFEPLLLHASRENMNLFMDGYSILKQVIQREEFYFRQDLLEGFVQVTTSSLAQLALLQDQADKEAGNKAHSRDELLFQSFLQEVQAHSGSERQLTFYASKAFMSTKYFAKLIYDVSGRHPSDWIKDNVILEAKVMLKSGIYNVKQVSDSLHFPNSSFFGKYFKSSVGLSPRQYMIEGRKSK
jgi:AraC family transcriptional activator of pobA